MRHPLTGDAYKAYLKSSEWKWLRKRIKKLHGYRCVLCNSDGNLHVHHRTYDRAGFEDDSDLYTLCDRCHAMFHGIVKGTDVYCKLCREVEKEESEYRIKQKRDKRAKQLRLEAKDKTISAVFRSFGVVGVTMCTEYDDSIPEIQDDTPVILPVSVSFATSPNNEQDQWKMLIKRILEREPVIAAAFAAGKLISWSEDLVQLEYTSGSFELQWASDQNKLDAFVDECSRQVGRRLKISIHESRQTKQR